MENLNFVQTTDFTASAARKCLDIGCKYCIIQFYKVQSLRNRRDIEMLYSKMQIPN